jgi:quercetin dioxygenase-like cupin family protein
MLVRDALQVEKLQVQSPGAENVTIQWLVDDKHAAPNFSLRRFSIEPEGCTPEHTHGWEHEVYILSGRGVLATAEGEIPLQPDTAVLVLPDELHQFRCTGAEPLEFLCLVPNGPATQGH